MPDEPNDPQRPVSVEYEPSRLEARFSHDTFDYIHLDLRIGGDVTWVTECDTRGESLAPAVRHQQASVEFTLYMSSPFCPFGDFVRFLEAVTIGVQECAFSWNAEGPDGEFRWESAGDDEGMLTVRWHSSREPFSRRASLSRREAVDTLYGAFRRFVESAEYDPLRFEQLTQGECLELVLQRESLDDLRQALVRLDAPKVAGVVSRMDSVVGSRSSAGPPLTFPLSHFLDGEDGADIGAGFFPTEWDDWSVQLRLEHLGKFFAMGRSAWFGANLRKLRSKLVEDWLALRAGAGGN